MASAVDAIDKRRLIVLPIVVVVLAISAANFFGYQISRRFFLGHLVEDGYNYVEMLAQKIETSEDHLGYINAELERRIRRAAEITIGHQEHMDNQFLAGVAELTDIDELFWYSPQGEILYSATGEYIGWTPTPGDPLDSFIKSDRAELIEPIRKSTDSEQHFLFYYLRDDNGYFVQAGMNAEVIQGLTADYNLQQVLETIALQDNIHYAMLIDRELVAAAHSLTDYVGESVEEEPQYEAAFQGERFAAPVHSESLDVDVLEVTIPFYREGEIAGALVVGLSVDRLSDSLQWVLVGFVIISFLLVLVFLSVQHYNISLPIIRIDRQLRGLTIDSERQYLLEYENNDPFAGLYTSMNELLERIYKYVRSNIKLRKAIEELAAQDPLTKVPNRRMLVDHLTSSLSKQESGAVIMLDLDNFKDVNDTYGHVYGDQILIRVAELLNGFAGDNVGVYRFGGDEFILLVTEPQKLGGIKSFVVSVQQALRQPLKVEDDEIHMRSSMGIALYPRDGNSVRDLIMYADLAMYSAKNSVFSSNYAFYQSSMSEAVTEKNRIDKLLRTAIKTGGLRLVYQPKVDAKTRMVAGYEGLIRLKHNNLPAGQLISVAEENGQIIELGRWVVKEAIYQLKSWQDREMPVKPISINFSAKQLFDWDYIAYLRQLIDETGVDPANLEIEITENLFIEQEETTTAFLTQLKDIGVRIALDDFGKGYSSLNYLSFMPVDALKLDKSMCDRYQDESISNIVEGIIVIARALNLLVVAEGIETQDQYECFRDAGCQLMQGYLFSKPVPIEEAESLYYKQLGPE